MFVYVPQQPPSRRAEQLGQKLTDLLHEAQRGDPNMSARDLDQAMRIARANMRGLSGAASARIAMVVVGLVVLFLGLGFYMLQRSGGLEWSTPRYLILAIIALVGLVAGAVAVLRR